MNENVMIIVALVGLILVVVTHIFIIARWSGRVDGSLDAILRQPNMWTNDLTAAAASIRAEMAAAVAGLKAESAIMSEEIKQLRNARHAADGTIMRHEGTLKSLEQTADRLNDRLFPREGHAT